MSKKLYESYIILDGNLEDAVIEEEIKKYGSFLTKNEAEINLVNRIGRKRLAYPIKKKQSGFYVCFEVLAPPEIITKLERTYILDENILRYLTIFVSLKTIKEKEEHFRNKAILQSKYDEAKEKENELKRISEAAASETPAELVTETIVK